MIAALQVGGGLEEAGGLVVVVHVVQVVPHGGPLGNELHHLLHHVMRKVLSHEVKHEAVGRLEVKIAQLPGVDLSDQNSSRKKQIFNISSLKYFVANIFCLKSGSQKIFCL